MRSEINSHCQEVAQPFTPNYLSFRTRVIKVGYKSAFTAISDSDINRLFQVSKSLSKPMNPVQKQEL